MSKPTLKAVAGCYRLTWADEQVAIEFTRLHQHSDGRVSAEIRVLDTSGIGPPHLRQSQINLLSDITKKHLAEELQKRHEAPWGDIIEQACVMVLTAFRQGEPVEELDNGAEPPPLRWLLEPFLLERQPTLIFADGGTGKSFLAQLLALCLLTDWEDNPLGAIPPKDVPHVLYLDWETDRDTTLRRWAMLGRGCNRPRATLDYRRCLAPLSDEVEIIQRLIVDRGIGLVVVDSLAGAAGGDLNENATARLFYQALRPLPVTPLLIAHTSKDPLARKKTPFGSTFFWNMARLVFELRHVQEAGADQVELGLFARKGNDVRRLLPVGYRLIFDGGYTVRAEPQKIHDVAEFAGELPLPQRIKDFLVQGTATGQEIAGALDIKLERVQETLSRLAAKREVLRLTQGKWGVISRQEGDR